MATSKERKDKLLCWADETIRKSNTIYDSNNHEIRDESYNGQIAAFSVTIALSGLKPAMALYMNEKGSSDINKKDIIEFIAKMYSKDKGQEMNADKLFKWVLELDDNSKKECKKIIIEYAIALKLAIRTFKFKKS